jgi:hypothetical protein
MTEARRSTAIHEAGHAVIGYALGRRLMRAVVFSDTTGEVLTQCSACETCKVYYYWHDPAKDPHSKRIQDDYRCDMAIAMAGGIAERAFCEDNRTNDKGELRRDEELTWSRAQAIHRWAQPDCWGSPEVPCQACEPYIALMKPAVEKIVGTPLIERCIRELGRELENCQQMDEKAIDQFLCRRCLERDPRLACFLQRQKTIDPTGRTS